MTSTMSFLAMGGYAVYVWPAFGIALAVLVALLLVSLRDLKSREVALKALETASPRVRRRVRQVREPA